MENSKENAKALNDVYKNAHIALQSISNLSPEVKDEKMKQELLEEYEGYEKIIGEISSFMAQNDIEPKDINPLKKAMLWSSIKMKTMSDKTTNNAADMMIKGTVMGITELITLKNESELELDDNVLELADKLLNLEQSYEERLKNFL